MTILVVDGDQTNCELLRDIFMRRGYRVLATTSGREALDLFRSHAPCVTLVDLEIPGMDGLWVLKEIRAINPQAAVITLAGEAGVAQESQARSLRVTEFIRKGLPVEILIDVVNRLSQSFSEPSAYPLSTGSHALMRTKDESVLVVDGDPLVRDLLLRFLSVRGYRAVGVGNGSEAARIIDDAPPDAILLDLLISDMSATDVIRSLREKEYGGAIILMTGSHNDEALAEAWAMEPQEVLAKPIDLERMIAVLQLVLVCREC